MTDKDALKKIDDWWLQQEHQSLYFDKHGVPITLGQWIGLFEDLDYRRVAFTDLGQVQISTVWLGIDHNFTRQGPPVIFETMLFGLFADLDLADRTQWRYRTLEEAQTGHERVVADVQKQIEQMLKESE